TGGQGMKARTAFLSVFAFPKDGSIGQASVNGDGKLHPLTTKAQPALSTSIQTSAKSDAWMGSWLTLQNTTANKRTVTIQSTMGGDPEGPPVRVTLPPHGVTTILAGLLCDEEPLGTLNFEVMMSAN